MMLHGYFRSSASYRVRIALNLKGFTYGQSFHHLRKGEQRAADYLALNPQGLVPALVLDDGSVLTQSLAICEYLDELQPQAALLPHEALARARVRAAAQLIACDVHPVQNLKVLAQLRSLNVDESAVVHWAAKAIEEGLAAFDTLIRPFVGTYCFGENVTLADICLVPQLANAKRFGVDYARLWPRLEAIERSCGAIGAFADARPENQPDAE